jgi:hypothetical protein
VAESETSDIALAVTQHYADGGRVVFVTLTLRHVISQSLVTLLKGLGAAWTACRQHKGPRALWSAYTVGFVRKLEVTFGFNGWHPHLHLLIFLKPGVSDDQVGELLESMFAAWSGRLERDRLGKPSRKRGLTWEILGLDAAQERVSRYMAKDAARELASAGSKLGRGSNRSTLQLLFDAAAGDPVAMLRYEEFEDAMKGKARVIWSDGLKARFLDPELQASADPEAEAREIAIYPQELTDRLQLNFTLRSGPTFPDMETWAEVYDDDLDAFMLVWRQCRRHDLPAPSAPERLRADALPLIRAEQPPPPSDPQLRLQLETLRTTMAGLSPPDS